MKTFYKFIPNNVRQTNDSDRGYKIVHSILCDKGDLIHITTPDGKSKTIECPDDYKALHIYQYDMMGVTIESADNETWIDMYELGD